MRSLLLAFLFFLSSPCFAQPANDDPVRRSIAGIQETLKQRPEDPTLWFYLASLQSRAGDKEASLAALQKVLDYGEGFLPTRELFGALWDDTRFKDLRAKLEAKLTRLDYAPTAIEIDDATLLPEGIAYDSPSHTTFLGSIPQKRIVRIDSGGAMSEFAGAEANLDSILGIAVDSPRRILYAVSTSALTEAGRKNRRNAVMAFDVDSRKLLRRVEIPSAVQLNDVAVAPGGRVFTTDSGSGAIYEIPPEGEARALVGPDQIRGSNGLAATLDGKRLYVAHSTGLAVVEIANGAWKRVAMATKENVAAIDGLYQWQGQLIGVQNVTTPGRLILITLSKDGDTVTKVQTMLSHHHNALDEPTTGAITDRGFYLLAATGVTHYNDKGEITDPEKLPRPTVLRIPLPR